MKKLLTYGFAFILLLSYVSAFGVAPAYKEIYFEPDLEQELEFRILNTQREDLRLALYTKNELGEYIEVPDEIIRLSADEYESKVRYKVRLPHKLTPGERKVEIFVVSVGESGTEFLQANIGIVHQLKVLVPYPDKFIQGELIITKTGGDEPVLFTISLSNLGEKDIKNIEGKIIIKDPNGEAVSSIKTNQISLESRVKSKLEAKWETDGIPGTFHAEIIIDYDDKVLILEKDFDVGKPLISIEDLRVHSFKLGTVAQFEIIMKNLWNKELTNVYATTQILDINGVPISEFKTGTVNIPPYGTKEVLAYWDTEKEDEGNYSIEIQANYLDRVKEKIYNLVVEQDRIVVEGSQITGQVTGERKTGFNTIPLLIVLNIILFGVIILLVLKKRKAKTDTIQPDKKQKLRSLINKKYKQGFSPKAIRKNFVDKGWNQELIDEVLLELEDEEE